MTEQLLNSLGLKEKIIIGDGHCFFRCLVHQIWGFDVNDPDVLPKVFLLRAEAVNFWLPRLRDPEVWAVFSLKSSESLATKYISDDIDRVTAYLRNLKEGNEWADEEVIEALSNVYRLKIIIIFKSTGHKYIVGEAFDQCVYLLYYENSHYNSVESIVSASDEMTTQSSTGSVPETAVNLIGEIGCFELRRDPFVHSQLENQTTENIKDPLNFRVGTWNLLGASLPQVQQAVDQELNEQGIEVLGVQETMTPSQYISTSGYKWYLSSGRSKDHGKSVRRGVGILVKKTSKFKVLKVRRISDRIISATLNHPDWKDIYIVVVHLPSRETDLDVAYSSLNNEINRLTFGQRKNLVLVGDFNAHLGKDLLGENSRSILGPALFHESTNDNGHSLMEFLTRNRLKVNTTFGKHDAMETWRRGDSRSQLDHIITMQQSSLFVNRIKGKYFERSDHKLVSGCFAIKKVESRPSGQRISNAASNPTSTTKTKQKIPSTPLNWDMSLLKNKEKCIEFRQRLAEKRNMSGGLKNWKQFSDLITHVSNELLAKEKPLLTPRRKSALDDLKRTLAMKRKNLATQSEVQLKRRRLDSEWNRFRDEECRTFFSNLNDFPYNERVKRMFQFIRNFKRSENQKGSRLYIPMTSWTRLLEDVAGPSVPVIEETDHIPLLPPPSLKELSEVIAGMKSGKAPGIDKITIDILKVLPDDLCSDLLKIVESIWISNTPPKEWNATIQFPIPKKAKPQSTNDFRRITLTNVIYRVVSYVFLKRLDLMIPALGDYQAAFLNNRSADDHIYTLRRVLEEEWNVGNYVLVASLDLEKAFDMVDLNVAVTVLKSKGVPHHFINRIIQICMWEQTKVLWNNQTTPTVNKSKGVKQGCPLSPRIFTLVLDAVITTVAEELNIPLTFENKLKLPMILAYADDLIILTRSKEQLKNILKKLFEVLETVGLKCNTNKSYVILRDPLKISPDREEEFMEFEEFKLKISDEVRYLGSQITADLSRRNTVRKRCNLALSVCNQLVPFIKKNKITTAVVVQMYNTVIFPLMTFGLKVTTLTRANRVKLRNTEKSCLRILLKFSYKKDNTLKRAGQLLRGKTVTRRVKVMKICYWGHVKRRPTNHMLQLSAKLSSTKKKVGRPSFTDKSGMNEAFSKYEHDIGFWEEKAKNKNELKREAEKIYENCLNDTSSEDDYVLSSDDEEYNITPSSPILDLS